MDTSALSRRRVSALLVVAALLLFGACVSHGASFGGIGLQVVPLSTGELVVLRVVEGGPAAGGDIRPGDLILSVDDVALKGSDFARIVPERLWGAPGTSVTLVYLRPGEEGMRSATLQRVAMEPQPIEVPGVQTLTPQ